MGKIDVSDNKKDKKNKKDNVENTKAQNLKKRKKYIVEEKNKPKERKKKVNIFKVIGRYFRGVSLEFKRIRWIDGKNLVKYSIAAVIFVIFFGLYFYGIDWIALLVRSLAN